MNHRFFDFCTREIQFVFASIMKHARHGIIGGKQQQQRNVNHWQLYEFANMQSAAFLNWPESAVWNVRVL